MKAFSRVVVIVTAAAACVSDVHAFSPTSSPLKGAATTAAKSRCFLHPDQASDLEACAYDLMKEALNDDKDKTEIMKNVLSKDISSKLVMEDNSGAGPVKWAKRKLWPFRGEEGGEGTTKLP